jgi:hypothetical protein
MKNLLITLVLFVVLLAPVSTPVPSGGRLICKPYTNLISPVPFCRLPIIEAPIRVMR